MTPAMTFAAMGWLRYQKNADVVCTEVGHRYLKDVLGLFIANDGLPASSIEIEVKASMSDLRRDFQNKAKKHEWYAEGRNCPNYLYYVVPQSMAENAKEFIRTKSTKYGIMEFNSEIFLERDQHPFGVGDSLKSIAKCTKLTDSRPSPAILYQMGRRLMNEYFLQRYEIQKRSSKVQGDLESYAKAIARRERGKVDKYCPLN